MEYVEAVLGTIGLLKDMWPSIYKCFNYSKILDKNCKTLDKMMDRLKCREQDVCTELQNAQYQRKKAKKEVENWLNEVQIMKDEVKRMEGEVRKGRCFSRLEFLRQSEENIEKVDELLERSRFPEGILIDVVRDEGKALLVRQLIGESTAKRNMEVIWKCMKEAGTPSIGVWGMGGIGKTTIVTHIHNLLLEEKDAFGAVFWVTVSKDSSIPKLQDAIAKKIHLDLSKEVDERIRSALLFEALQREKKFVLIFDDVWEVYPPEDVGIPVGVAADGGGGRLVITSRSRDVCQKMSCRKIIKVEPLQMEESWELFNTTLDRYNALSQKEEKVAKDIVKECAGLPLAVVTTARSMSVVYDIAEWRNALNELRERVKGPTINLEDDVFKILEFSYSRLNDVKLQECLLYCALFPEDYVIGRIDLIRYWIAEGLVEEMGSGQDERDRGHAILNKLENVSLLERCGNGTCVKMHDVTRDMAINITGRSCRFMVKIGINNMEDLLPTEQTDLSTLEWSNNNNLERVSLIDNRLSSSMSVPNINCPKLSTLLLQNLSLPLSSRQNEGLPNSLFMNMVGLKVLDLSYRDIEFLPDSFYEMVNLRALILFRCGRLKQIDSLAKLTELRKLDLRGNELERLPDGIDKLVHLKEFLWMSNVKKGLITPSISNLVHLQSLVLHDRRFRVVGMKELSGLRKLEILSISFFDLLNFNTYFRKLPCPRLTHYRVVLNGNGSSYTLNGLSKEVGVQNCRLIGGKENDASQLVLPANLQVLQLFRCKLLPNGMGLMDVSPSLKMAMDLKVCDISECEGIEYVWWADGCIVSSVNTLSLRNLPNLRVLFKLRLTENIVSCSSLKHLFVSECHNLKHLFPAELVKSHHLQNLESIIVCDCDQMEDIIILAEVDEEEKGINNDLILCFPNLRSLCLKDVPNLKSIWKGKMTCASIQRLAVEKCPNLRRLPLSSDSTPSLKEIWGEKQWWDEVEWEPKSLFQPLFKPLPSNFSNSGFSEFIKDHQSSLKDIYEDVSHASRV